MNKLHVSLLLFTLLILLLAGCKPETTKTKQADIQVKVPSFNADSAYAYVAKQVSFGPRFVNSDGHKKCREWLVQKLSDFNFQVIEQDFTAKAYTGEDLNGTNIIGRYNEHIEERVLLAAHWDTRHIADKDSVNTQNPILGADDGASGVGVILEISRQIQMNPIPMGLDVIFFDAEDYGSDNSGEKYTWGLGSQHWASNIHEDNYTVKYGILLDMVGSKGATFYKEEVSRTIAPDVTDAIWKLAQRMGKQDYFRPQPSPGITDDHLFVYEGAKIPMVDIVNMTSDGQFGDYHHRHTDNMDIIDKTTLGVVGQVVLAVVYNESNKRFIGARE